MAIIIPSSNIYKAQNEKVRDNYFDRFERNGNEVLPDYQYEVPAFNSKIKNSQGVISFERSTGFTNEQYYNDTTPEGVYYEIVSASGSIIVDKYITTDIKIKKVEDNLYISKILSGEKDKEKEESYVKITKKYQETILFYKVDKSFDLLPSLEDKEDGTFYFDKIINYNGEKEVLSKENSSYIKNYLVDFNVNISNSSIGDVVNIGKPSVNENEKNTDDNITTSLVVILANKYIAELPTTDKLSFTETDLMQKLTVEETDNEYIIKNLKVLIGRTTYSCASVFFMDKTDESSYNNRPSSILQVNQDVVQTEITIYGNTIGINLQEKTIYIPSTDKTSKKVLSFESNELIQTSNYFLDTNENAVETMFGNTLSLYKNGKETATLRCSIGDYYNYDENSPNLKGKKVISTDVKGYKELKYIESTGTQWFDTGYIPNTATAVETVVSGISADSFILSSSGTWFFGGRQAYLNNAFGSYYNPTQQKLYYAFGKQMESGTITTLYDGKKKFYADENGMYVDDIKIVSMTSNAFTSPVSLTLFGLNNNGTTISYTAFRLHYFKIWDNGNLIRDFIPVLDYNDVPCLYDKVSKSFFYNKGTGVFNYELRIPSEYQQVEYIESTGTQYIDTDVTINTATDEVELVFENKERSVYKWFFGEHDDNARFGLGSGDGENKRNVAYGNTTYKVTDAQIYGEQHVFLANKNGVFLDGVKIGAYSSFSSMSTLYLFNLNLSGGNYCASAKIWSYKHTRNGTLIRELIPCYRKSDNVAGLYDIENGEFYTNQGTGSFIRGDDVTSIEKLNMTFNLYDEVIPMVYSATGKDKPMSTYNDGTPKTFQVLGTKIYYDGVVWQELYLQELDKPSVK